MPPNTAANGRPGCVGATTKSATGSGTNPPTTPRWRQQRQAICRLAARAGRQSLGAAIFCSCSVAVVAAAGSAAAGPADQQLAPSPNLSPARAIIGSSNSFDYQAAVEAANLLGVTRRGACSGCHNTRDANLIRHWHDQGRAAAFCLAQPLATPQQKWRCLSGDDNLVTAADIGIYSGRPEALPLRDLMQQLYPDDYADRWARLKQGLQMPRPGPPLDATTFGILEAWFAQDLPFLDELIAPYKGPLTCTPSLSPQLSQHLDHMRYLGWQAENHNRGLAMFGCTPTTATKDCLGQRDPHGGQELFPTVANDPTISQPPAAVIGNWRKLFAINATSRYWLRTSADGRFVAYATATGRIHDLAARADPSRTWREIRVTAQFDPAFTPDNSAFLFQGDATGFCQQDILTNPLTTRIDFASTVGCSNQVGTGIGLYQGIGASLDEDYYLAATSDYQSDQGLGRQPAPATSPFALTTLTPFLYDGNAWQIQDPVTFATPWLVDATLSPSNNLLAMRKVVAVAGVTYDLGYEIFSIQPQHEPDRLSFNMQKVGHVCTAGTKAQFSYDERFLVTSHYRPASADLIVIDLTTGATHTLNQPHPGTYWLFPHTRADGWLYVLYFDKTNNERHVLASDALLYLP